MKRIMKATMKTWYRLARAAKYLKKSERKLLLMVADGEILAWVLHPRDQEYWLVDPPCIKEVLNHGYDRFCPHWWPLGRILVGNDFPFDALHFSLADLEVLRSFNAKTKSVLDKTESRNLKGAHWKANEEIVILVANKILHQRMGRKKYLHFNGQINANGLADEVKKRIKNDETIPKTIREYSIRTLSKIIRSAIKSKKIPTSPSENTD